MAVLVSVVLLMVFASLTVMAIYLLYRNRVAAATSALSFSFLFAIVLTISNYKHINGFGFEAEMWDSTQNQAASLINNFKEFAISNGVQLSLLTAQSISLNSTMSNSQIKSYAEKLKVQGAALGISPQQIEEMVTPLYGRIEANYLQAAQTLMNEKVGRRMKELNFDPNKGMPNAELQALLALREAALHVSDYPSNLWVEYFERICDNQIIKSDEALVRDINDIMKDLKQFQSDHTIRRDIRFDMSLGLTPAIPIRR